MSELEEIYNQLKTLAQYRNKPDSEILEAAKQKLKEQDIDISNRFKTPTERKIAKQLLQKYIRDFTVDSISDRNTLAEIIYFEVVQKRLQDKMNKMYDSDNAVPINFLELMHRNSDTIIKLKNSLGLDRSRQEAKSGYDAFQHYLKRHRKWMDENQASRELKCPHCQRFILLKIRTNIWETQKHPFFKDSRLYNKALFNSFGQTITIDRDFIANVLETSLDYIDWMVEKINQSKNQEAIMKETR